jgi:signal peptidase II
VTDESRRAGGVPAPGAVSRPDANRPAELQSEAAPRSETAAGRRRWPLFLALAGTIVVVDQVAKALVTGALAPGQSVDVVGDLVRIVFGQNSGALFGLFKDNAAMFGVVSLVVVGLIVAYHARAAASPYLTLTLGLLLGGAVGNMIDRLRLGFVVDFVDVGVGPTRFYTFNIADSAISVAILLLFLAALRPSLVEGRGTGTATAPAPVDVAGAEDDWDDDGPADDSPAGHGPADDSPAGHGPAGGGGGGR